MWCVYYTYLMITTLKTAHPHCRFFSFTLRIRQFKRLLTNTAQEANLGFGICVSSRPWSPKSHAECPLVSEAVLGPAKGMQYLTEDVVPVDRGHTIQENRWNGSILCASAEAFLAVPWCKRDIGRMEAGAQVREAPWGVQNQDPAKKSQQSATSHSSGPFLSTPPAQRLLQKLQEIVPAPNTPTAEMSSDFYLCYIDLCFWEKDTHSGFWKVFQNDMRSSICKKKKKRLHGKARCKRRREQIYMNSDSAHVAQCAVRWKEDEFSGAAAREWESMHGLRLGDLTEGSMHFDGYSFGLYRFFKTKLLRSLCFHALCSPANLRCYKKSLKAWNQSLATYVQDRFYFKALFGGVLVA